MVNYDYDYTDELYHHGIKGMRWGVRRYQNKDGSLTDAGQRHRKSIGETIHAYRVKRKRKKALEKARETRAANMKAAAERKKRLEAGKIKTKDMTEAEINEKMARLKLEKDYNDLVKEQRPSRANKFINKFLDATVEKLADNVGADLVAQTTKVILAEGANVGLKQLGLKPDVHTNNKKKN